MRYQIICTDPHLEHAFWYVFNLFHQKVAYMTIYDHDKLCMVVTSNDIINQHAFLKRIEAKESETPGIWLYGNGV